MITAQELRIGNWVQLYVAGPKQVREVKKYNVEFEGIDNGSFYDYNIVHGIPLTPEILEKMGFEKQADGFYCKLGHSFYLTYYTEEKVICTEVTDGQIIHHNHIKHVHQVQNIYLALTGSDLPPFSL